MKKGNNVDQLITLIFNIRQVLHEKMAEKSSCQISLLQLIALKYIQAKKPLMKDIAGYLSITPPSATSLINNLLKSKLITRVADKKDRRIVRIEITKQGSLFIKKHMSAMSNRMRKGLESLTLKEQEQMSKILTKLIEAYKK